MTDKKNFRHTMTACWIGYVTQALVNTLPPLLFLTFQETFGLPLSKITALITVNFMVQLMVDYLSAHLLDRIGYKRAIVGAHLLAAVGMIGMAVFPAVLPSPFAGLLAAVIIYALGGGVIEVLISPIADACPTENKTAAMNLLHSFYCWGTVAVILLTTAFFAVFGRDSWRWLACVWALLPLGNAVFFSRVPIASLTEDGAGMSAGELFRNGRFWMFAGLMFASGASELSMSQWASAFAESGLGVSKTVGDLAGPCMFAALMGLSRVIAVRIDGKVSVSRQLGAGAVLAILSYLLASFSPSPVGALIGCALCGFSVGIMWPGVFSMASASFKRGGTVLFAFLALAGDIGCTVGPTTVGLIAGLFGDDLRRGVLVGAIFPALLCVFLAFAAHRRRKS